MMSMHGLEETDGGMFKQGSDVMSGSSDQLGAEKSVDDGINVIRWYKMDEDFWMRSSAS